MEVPYTATIPPDNDELCTQESLKGVFLRLIRLPADGKRSMLTLYAPSQVKTRYQPRPTFT